MGITADAGLATDGPDTHAELKPANWMAVSLQATYYDSVFAYFARRVRPREEAEDLTAETFLAAFKSIKQIGAKQQPKLFLFGIARRKLADSLRKRRPNATVTNELVAEGPALDAETRALANTLRTAIEALPEDQAEALLLQHLEGLSIREVAEVMNRSELSVKALVQRARENLRKDSQLRAFMEEPNE